MICDQIEMATALLELEKFSLFKWYRSKKSITIHRLMQVVVSDEMSNEESRSTLSNIIDLFKEAFPEFTTNETRSLCRRYEGQIVEPLLHIITIHTSKSAHFRVRVGEFRHYDGKYDDSEKLLLQAVEIYTSFSGSENSETRFAMHALAVTYQVQGRKADAARIQEEVLEKERISVQLRELLAISQFLPLWQ